MDTVVVVPTYNEVENLGALCRGILDSLSDACVLIVDDNSPDGTGALADRLHDENPDHVHVLHRDTKSGLGAAYVAGYTHALATWPKARYFVQMDADLSHDPDYLPDLVGQAQHADLVVASRYVDGISIVNWPLERLIISKLGTAYARLATGLPITDCTAGFKCYRRAVLEAIELHRIRSNGYVFQVESSFRAYRMGFKLIDFPIVFYERRHGQSKLNLRIAFEAFFVVLRLGVERISSRRKSQPAQAESEPSG